MDDDFGVLPKAVGLSFHVLPAWLEQVWAIVKEGNSKSYPEAWAG